MKWRKVKLEKAFALIRNGASIKQTEGKSGVPITRIETISNGVLDYSRMGFADVLHGAYQDYYLQKGDILMSHINSWSHLGKCALVEDSTDPVIHGMNLLVLRSDQSQLLPRFANYFFRTAVFKLQLNRIANQSVNQSSFAVTKLKELEMPLPPLTIQKQIADTLDKADALRRKDQELLTKYDELAQSIFYEMFGDPVKNERGWETSLLPKCVQMLGGGTPDTARDDFYDGDIPWVSPKDMKMSFVKDSIDKITPVAVAESSTKIIEANSVLLVVRSGILKKELPVAINTVPVAINQDMKALVCTAKVNPVFLMYQIKALSFPILSTVRGTTADNISSDVLRKTRLILPARSHQDRFAEAVQSVFRQKEYVLGNLRGANSIFKGLLQRFFS